MSTFLMRQASSDMQKRIQSASCLVVGRLVRPPAQDQPDDKPFTTYISIHLQKRKLRSCLSKAGSQDSPDTFAAHFDEVSMHDCGEKLLCCWSHYMLLCQTAGSNCREGATN